MKSNGWMFQVSESKNLKTWENSFFTFVAELAGQNEGHAGVSGDGIFSPGVCCCWIARGRWETHGETGTQRRTTRHYQRNHWWRQRPHGKSFTFLWRLSLFCRFISIGFMSWSTQIQISGIFASSEKYMQKVPAVFCGSLARKQSNALTLPFLFVPFNCVPQSHLLVTSYKKNIWTSNFFHELDGVMFKIMKLKAHLSWKWQSDKLKLFCQKVSVKRERQNSWSE